ncbi:hypothetical protein HYH02_001692 [Chlamydomonas schloesseri]|uniref:Nuclease associated modular domain-containing protein n=1 Tax=Chlamydomonas schloesseri TaxID=2026947 RepID=A0A836BBD7_9CHLO|nr:hypothetical protein HYH02_001692 [Chlamydomonas schloesseri]|eukprot:KAG2453471.1 hypothetical protein HYH02_001692 [Chlamydomonas schloesseri]
MACWAGRKLRALKARGLKLKFGQLRLDRGGHCGVKRSAMTGRKLSAATKAAISKAMTGRKLSAATKAAMSKAMTGRKHSAATEKRRTAKKRSTEADLYRVFAGVATVTNDLAW